MASRSSSLLVRLGPDPAPLPDLTLRPKGKPRGDAAPEEGVDPPTRTGLPGPREPALCTAPERLLSCSFCFSSFFTSSCSFRTSWSAFTLEFTSSIPAPPPLPPATRSNSRPQGKSRRKGAAAAHSSRGAGIQQGQAPPPGSHLLRFRSAAGPSRAASSAPAPGLGEAVPISGLGRHLPSVPPPPSARPRR